MSQLFLTLFVDECDLYLLSWADVGIDLFEDRLQGAVVPHAQILDLNLTPMRPTLRNLRRR